MDKDDRKRLIKLAADAVRKAHRGSISDVASRALEFPSVWASTGSLSLDRLCSGRNPGGIPMGPSMGRVIHIAGEWSTGKSLILDHMFKSVIVDLKGMAKCTETEGSRDPHFANAIGLPLDLLVIDRPDTFEQAFDMFETWHNTIRKEDEDVPILWGFDSLDSTEAEKSAKQGLSKGGGWHFGGGRSEVLGAGLRRMAKLCSRYPTTIVLLNQTRDAVGQFAGPKKTTPGGNPPHFYASLELMLSAAPRPGYGYVRTAVPMPALSKDAIKRLGLYSLFTKEGDGVSERGAVVGRYIRAKCTKSKVGETFDTFSDFFIDFRRGVHKWEGLAERLMFEGKLKCAPDGASDYTMVGVPDRFPNGDAVVQKKVDGTEVAEDVVFKTKKDWLNWMSKHMEELDGAISALREEE